MLAEISQAVRSLKTTARALVALADVSSEVASWKPAPDRWSILEVINHLADEEAEDFRARLNILLHDPEAPFPPIDPRGWVTARAYATRDLRQSVARFEAERERSLTWLAGLAHPQLDRTRVHPMAGTLSGRSLLAAWMAHDLLHVRQINRLRYQYLASQVGSDAVAYAGPW